MMKLLHIVNWLHLFEQILNSIHITGTLQRVSFLLPFYPLYIIYNEENYTRIYRVAYPSRCLCLNTWDIDNQYFTYAWYRAIIDL